MQLVAASDICRETSLTISGENAVPAGLEDYTDGYMAAYTMDMGEMGVYYEEFTATCFGVEEDATGYFCLGVLGGDDDGKLAQHGAGYWTASEDIPVEEYAEGDAYGEEYYAD
jgi:hypothetical protein